MLTLLSGGDLEVAKILSSLEKEFKEKLLDTINKTTIFDLQEFVVGYMNGYSHGLSLKHDSENKIINYLKDIKSEIASDTKSITYQTMGQYRTALISMIDKIIKENEK